MVTVIKYSRSLFACATFMLFLSVLSALGYSAEKSSDLQTPARLAPEPEAVGKVYKIPAGTQFYHWGPKEMIDWAKRGFPDDAGMKARRAKGKFGGYFVSLDITDSIGFGPVLVVHETEREIQIGESRLPYASSVQNGYPLDGFGDGYPEGEKKWLAVTDPAHVFPKNHLATIDDFYKTEKFRFGSFTLGDFLRIESSYPLRVDDELKLRYPKVYKLLLNQPLSEVEKQATLDELFKLMPNNLFYALQPDKRGSGELGAKIKIQFRNEMIRTLRARGLTKGDVASLNPKIPAPFESVLSFFEIPKELVITDGNTGQCILNEMKELK